ncbi:hypothetical protein C0J52_12049 [Blattella germanica]|nr:hypothetical protein C0J52_12049 [Blattella germanica]
MVDHEDQDIKQVGELLPEVGLNLMRAPTCYLETHSENPDSHDLQHRGKNEPKRDEARKEEGKEDDKDWLGEIHR